MDAISQQLVPIFDGDKYDFWRIKMTTILKSRELWTVVEDGVSVQPDQNVHTPEVVQLRNQWREASLKDMKALQILQMAVTDQIFSWIARAENSKKAWDLLKSEYEGTPQVRLIKLQSLRREYENLKINEGDNIKVFTDKVIELGSKLRVHGEEKTDYQIVQKILISLPEKFDIIVTVMEQTKDLTSLPITELIGTLKAHEKRVTAREENTTEGAFNARTRGGKYVFKTENKSHGYQDKGTKKWCEFCKRENHTERECWRNPKKDPTNSSKEKRECYNCGQVGHFARECRSKKHEQAHVSLEDKDIEDEMLFSASEKSAIITKEDVWLVDSGCTNHMTREERYFIRLDRSINVPIKVGNGEVVMTVGKGDITVSTSTGKRVIKDVFLVPGVEKNLLSVPQIISSGYSVLFENKCCTILESTGKKIMEIPMVNKSFSITWNSSQERAMVIQEEESEIISSYPRMETEACFVVYEEPQSYDIACGIQEWRDAMSKEIKMIEKNRVWAVLTKLEKKNVISMKWIYRIKTDTNGVPLKYKARLVLRDVSQELGDKVKDLKN